MQFPEYSAVVVDKHLSGSKRHSLRLRVFKKRDASLPTLTGKNGYRSLSVPIGRWALALVVLLISVQTASAAPVSSWDFNGTLNDSCGASVDSLSPGGEGSVRYVTADELPGVDGQALAIGVKPGDIQYFTAAASVDTKLGATYTIEAWIHPIRIADTWDRLFLKWTKEQSVHFAIHEGMVSLLHKQADGEIRVCEGGQLETHHWYHVVAVASRLDEDPAKSSLEVYLNGKRLQATDFDGTINTCENDGVGLGDLFKGGGGVFRYRGHIDGLALWNRALSADEIRQRCSRRADILNQSTLRRRLEAMRKERPLETALAMLESAIAGELEEYRLDIAVALLDDSDPFVRAMAEWAITRKVGRDNNHEKVTWGEDSEQEWFRKWSGIPLEERVEMDWCKQAVSLGIHDDAPKLKASLDDVIKRAGRMGSGGSVQGDLLGLRAEMDNTEDIKELRQLWLQARRVLRPFVFAKAALDFDEVILYNRFALHHRPNVSGTHASWTYKPGGDVVVVSGLEKHRGQKPLIRNKLGPGHVHGVDLHFDANKIVFAWAKQPEWPPRFPTSWPCPENTTFSFELRNTTIPPHLYEMDIESGDITQLTDHNFWTDVEPAYCPDGTIVFSSDRSAHGPSCDYDINDQSDQNIYSLSADRKRIRRLANQKDVDLHPHLLDNGLIAYLRWEYQERGFMDVHSVWTVKPDGTMADALFKQHLGAPLSVRDARSVPGTSKLVAIAAGHHCVGKGPVVILDPTGGINNQEAIRILTFGPRPQEGSGASWKRTWDKQVVDDGGVHLAGGFFMMPYAVSKKAFLVSYGYGNKEARRYTWADVDSNGLGVYLIDSYGNMELVYRSPLYSCYSVLPFTKRKRPPVLPDTVDIEKNYATCVVSDVYDGLNGVPRGTVKYIRIAEALPWPIVPGEGTKLWCSPRNRWCPVRVIGTVPVEEDGSAYFKVPVADNASVYFQALDEKHMEVRRMRSSVSFQPGEQRSCNGCHETQALAPAHQQRKVEATKHDAVMPQEPEWGGNRQLGFEWMVQPVLDNHCVRCHGGEQPKKGLNFAAGKSFATITDAKLVSLADWFSGNGSTTQPYQQGSHKSKLITQLLKKDTPCKADFDENEWIRLVTWVDANAPNQGGMLHKRTSDGRRWVWSKYAWKDIWATPREVPAMGDYIKLPGNVWRKSLLANE